LSGPIALVGFRFFNNFDVPSGVILKPQDHKFQMHDIIITPEGTSKLLKNLNPTKAIGPDKISPILMVWVL
jgi:hypothetical protein